MFVTLLAWLVYLVDQFATLLDGPITVRRVGEAALFAAIITVLVGSGLHYLIARVGCFDRLRNHHRTPRSIIDQMYERTCPSVTVIVPSYREDGRVIRQTLWSAALQEYPGLHIALLVDDPPNPTAPEHRRLLEEARAIPAEIQARLDPIAAETRAVLERFDRRAGSNLDRAADAGELWMVADAYDDAADWLRTLAREHDIHDRSDEFLVDEVLLALAEQMTAIARAADEAADESGEISARRVRALLCRLTATFDATLTSFERKAYASLSHEANKAMNLNSYLGLMGGEYAVRDTGRGKVLLPVEGRGDLSIPDADYVLTLDADSTLLPEYCLRLVHRLEEPGNERLAVAQTPYSSYREAPSRIERMAGATTDLQHLVHLGMARFGATFWVGANAVIRRRALDDIVQVENEGGFEIRRYIQDRTVIEDTESTLDLGCTVGSSTTSPSGSPTARPRPTSARCASSASDGPTVAC